MKPHPISCIALILMAFTSHSSIAATVSWDGGGDGSTWTDAANWDTNVVPTAADDVVINVAGTPTVSIPSSRSLQSLDCQEDLTISGTLSLTQGISTMAGTLQLNPNAGLTADGGTVAVSVSGTVAMNNANLRALNGATLTLPGLTSYTRNQGGTRNFHADGAGSLLLFPNLTSISPRNSSHSVTSVKASAGGHVDMPILADTGNGALHFRAEGASSRIDLPQLASFDGTVYFNDSGFHALNGGTIHVPLLTSLTQAHFELDATSSMQFAQITEFLGDGTVEVSQAVDFTNLTTFQGARLIIDEAEPSFPILADIDNATISVRNGKSLSLPLVTSYTHDQNTDRTLEAVGAGSSLAFPNLASMTPRANAHDDVFVNALDGGNVSFPKLTVVNNGAATLKADGAGSQLDLPLLASFDGYLYFTDSGFYALNGGDIDAPGLLTIQDAHVRIDPTSTMQTAQLQSITGSGRMHVSQALAFTDLVTLGCKLQVTDAVPSFPMVSSLDNGSIEISGGLTLSLPLVTSYTHNLNTDTRWRSTGTSSVLSLPNLSTITPRASSHDNFFIEALDGGHIDLPGLATVTNGAATFKSDGTGSYIDLTQLQTFDGYLYFTDSGFYASNGGTLHTPSLTTVQDGHLNVDASSSMGLGTISSVTGGGSLTLGAEELTNLTTLNHVTLNVGNPAPSFPSLTNIDNSSVIVTSGNTFSLPLVTSYTHNSNADFRLEASGAGSVLSLPNLTDLFPHTGLNDEIFVNALDGGQVLFPSLETSHPGAALFRATGAGSLIDLPSLTSFEGHFWASDSGFRAIDDGTITLPATEAIQIAVANVEVTNGGTITGSTLSLADTVTVTGDASITANVLSNAAINPTGILTIDGAFSQYADGEINLDVNGLTPGSGYDQLAITGLASLDGTLEITGANFSPFPLVEVVLLPWGSAAGTFATINVPDLGDDIAWDARFFPTSLNLHAMVTRGPWVIGDGDGLNATYYNDETLTNAVLTRVDPLVDFDWVRETPAPEVTVDHFSVRWTGQVLAPLTDDFAFHGITDDGVRLWVDLDQSGTFESNELLIEDWTQRPVRQHDSAPVSLVAGELYDIRMDYFEDRFEAVARLHWSTATLPRTPIPTSQLYSTSPNLTEAPTISPVPFTYQQAVDVTLSSAHTVRYTTNGTTPTVASPLYTGPITLTEDTFLQTRAFSPGAAPSPVLHATYLVEQELPDLRVSSVTVPASIQPGNTVEVSWTVENLGLGAFNGTRVDAFLLSNDANFDSSDPRVISFAITDVIPASGSQSYTRNYVATTETPNGDLTFIALADANEQHPEVDETNNAQAAASTTNVPAFLSISLSASSVLEGADAHLTLSRNGDIASPLTVNLSPSIANELDLPGSVTIPAGAWSFLLPVTAVDDTLNDGDQSITVTASAPGYPNALATTTTIDNDLPFLALQLTTPSTIAEGAGVGLTISRNPVTSSPLIVFPVTTLPEMFAGLPEMVTIPADEASVFVSFVSLDDTALTGDQQVTLSAQAEGHLGGATALKIIDDDIPQLSLSVAPTTVSEAEGERALVAEITRTPASESPLTVQLSNSNPTALSGPTSVVIPAFEASASVSMSAVDTSATEGTRTAALRAHLDGNLASSDTVPVTILDDEMPALSFSLSSGFVAEGQSISATVSRQPVTGSPVSVTVSVSDAGQVQVSPTTVLIPANAASATFAIAGIEDGIDEGLAPLTLLGGASGHNQASKELVVTDQSFSDLIVTDLVLPGNGQADEVFTYGYTLRNVGLQDQQTPFLVRAWLSRDELLSDDDLLLGQTLEETLPTDVALGRSASARAPDERGAFYLIVETDADNAVAEMVETNNVSVSPQSITFAGDYTVTVSTETEVAYLGETIAFTGMATHADGSPAGSQEINLYLIVDGAGNTKEVFTEPDGTFLYQWHTGLAWLGAYEVTAAHPASPVPPAQDTFDIVCLEVETEDITVALEKDAAAVTRNIAVTNKSAVPFTVMADVLGAESGVSATVTQASQTIPPLATMDFELSLSASASAPSEDQLTVRFAVDGVIRETVDLGLFVDGAGGRLVVDPPHLEMGAVRGEQDLYEINVKNIGATSTGSLDVVLPGNSWISPAVATPLDSLLPGESATVALQFCPPADAALGLFDGVFVVRGEGSEASIPFSAHVASIAEGSVHVRVTDELSYWDAAGGYPLVEGALVELRDPYEGSLRYTAVTDVSGEVTFSGVPEGSYELRASEASHTNMVQVIHVRPGLTTSTEAFLRRGEVTYTFSVTPVEIEDRTEITVTTEFETNVPMPVITVDPVHIDFDQLLANRPETLTFTVENHGLIAVQDVSMNFDAPDGWALTRPGGEDFTLDRLPAKTQIQVQVQIGYPDFGATVTAQSSTGGALTGVDVSPTFIDLNALLGFQEQAKLEIEVANHSGSPINGATLDFGLPVGWQARPVGSASFSVPHGQTRLVPYCFVRVPVCRRPSGYFYHYLECGGRLRRYATPISMASRRFGRGCRSPRSVVHAIGGGGIGRAVISPRIRRIRVNSCNECLLSTAEDCISRFSVPRQAAMLRSAANWSRGGFSATSALRRVLIGARGMRPGTSAAQVLQCEASLLTCLAAGGGSSPLLQTRVDGVRRYAAHARAICNYYTEVLGSPDWLASTPGVAFDAFAEAFADAIVETSEEGFLLSAAEIAALQALEVPSNVTASHVTACLERWNRSVSYWGLGYRTAADVPSGQVTDFIEPELVEQHSEGVLAALDTAAADDYENPYEGFQSQVGLLYGFLSSGEGVCATVKLEIKQEAVVTQTAFDAELEITNSSTEPITAVDLDLRVINADTGEDATVLFAIPEATYTGISGQGGSLGAETTGTVHHLIRPKREAASNDPEADPLLAPDVPTTYIITGTLNYTFEGAPISVNLTEEFIEVYPQADLRLKYFQQRDVISDDPFTDPIEPAVPFSLGVMVENVGPGTARNLHIASSQPEIVENEKGLLVDFRIIGAQVEEEEVAPGLTIGFEDLLPNEIKVARWLMESSLHGHFIGFEARFEHLTDAGFENVSAINGVAIHEMIHAVDDPRAGADEIPDFLTNDLPDPADAPDTIHLSTGDVEPVTALFDATTTAPTSSMLSVPLTFSAPTGHVYLSIPDPSDGTMVLVGVTRSDGRELPLGTNVWGTDRTFIGLGLAPVYENKLHLYDHGSTGSYTLIYALTPPPPVYAWAGPCPRGYSGDGFSCSSPGESPRFEVEWSDEPFPGVEFFVAVSTNGGEYVSWIDSTTATSALFEGEPNTEYSFIATATGSNGQEVISPHTLIHTTGAANSPPDIAPISDQTVNENERFVFTPTVTISEGDAIQWSLEAGAPAGVSIDSAAGEIRWQTSDADGWTSLSLTVTATGLDGSDSETFTLDVIDINDPPELQDSQYEVEEDTAISLQLASIDRDLPLQTLSYAIDTTSVPPELPYSPPEGMSLSSTGLLTWTTPEVSQGTQTFIVPVIISDDGSPPSQSFSEVVIDVRNFSEAPVVNLVSNPILYQENLGPVPVDSVAQVIDPDSETFPNGHLAVQLMGQPDTGEQLSLAEGVMPGGQTVSLSGQVVVVESESIATIAGQSATTLSFDLNGNATPQTVATLLRAVRYENPSDTPSTTERQVRVVLNDGDSGISQPAIRAINALPMNDAPIPGDDHVSTLAGVSVHLSNLLANDTDVEGDALSIESLTQPASGSVSLAGDVVTYTPAGGFTGTTTFTYVVKDAPGAEATGTVHVTVAMPADFQTDLSLDFEASGDLSFLAQDIPSTTFEIWATDDLSAWERVAILTPDDSGTLSWSYTPPEEQIRRMFELRLP